LQDPTFASRLAPPSAREVDPRSLTAIMEITGPAAFDAPLVEPLPKATDEAGTIDEWLTSRFGLPQSSTAVDKELVNITARLLVDADERPLAQSILLAHLVDLTGDEAASIELSATAAATGLDDVALLGTIRVLRTLDTKDRLETPTTLEQLAYPAAWPELLTAASEEFDVSPLLMLALIRQESSSRMSSRLPALWGSRR